MKGGKEHPKTSNIPAKLVDKIQERYVTPYTDIWYACGSNVKTNAIIFKSNAYEHAVREGHIIGQGSLKFHVAINFRDLANVEKAIHCLFKEVITQPRFADLRFQFKVETPTSHMRKGAGITFWIPPNKALCGGDEEKASTLWYNFGLEINKALRKHRIKTTHTTKTDKRLYNSSKCFITYRIGPNGSGPHKNNNECYGITGEWVGTADYDDARTIAKNHKNHNPHNWNDPVDNVATLYNRSRFLFSKIHRSVHTSHRKRLGHHKNSCVEHIWAHCNVYKELLSKHDALNILKKNIETADQQGKSPTTGFKQFESSHIFKTVNKKQLHHHNDVGLRRTINAATVA